MKRRKVLKSLLFEVVSLVIPAILLNKAEAGFGPCTPCDCPGFDAVSGSTCPRSGCGHHFDAHWQALCGPRGS